MTDSESQASPSIRLQILINRLNTNGLNFAKSIGVSQSFVSSMVSGRTNISRSAIDKIHDRYPNFNIHWLLTGEGEVFFPENATESPAMLREPASAYRKSTKDVLAITVMDDASMRKVLGGNLKSLADRWRMKKNKMFGLLLPGVAKQSVTNYLSGHSQPPLAALIRLEHSTGIGLSAWLTRTIEQSEMPLFPLEGESASSTDQLTIVKGELRALLNRLGG